MKKTKVGKVVSNKMQKTVTVLVQRTVKDPDFGKYVRRNKKLLAHDEKSECKIGDVVQIVETRPISRHKSWKVQEILKKGVQVEEVG